MKLDEKMKFCIKKEWRIALLATFIAGIAAHGYKFLNMLPNWDSLTVLHDKLDLVESARCFLRYANMISSDYDIPWLIGLLSLCYLGLVSILLIELFDVHKTYSIIIMSSLLAVFPSVTSTFAYMPWADAYLLGLLLSVLAVYVTVKFKKGFLLGSIFLCFSFGIYQTYISCTLLIIILLLLKEIAAEDYCFKKYRMSILRYAAMVILGGIFYYISYKSIIFFNDTQLVAYQGFNSVGLMSPGEYFTAVIEIIRATGYFILGNSNPKLNFYRFLNGILMSVLVYMIVRWILINRYHRAPKKLIWILFLFFSIPFVNLIYYLVTPDIQYHMLMKMAFYFLYFMVILGLDQIKFKGNGKWRVLALSTFLSLFVYVNVINANVAYLRMQLSYETVYSQCQVIMTRITNLENLDIRSEIPIGVWGDYPGRGDLYRNIPELTGFTDTNFIWGGQGKYVFMFEKYMGLKCRDLSGTEWQQIQGTEEYKSMKAFPASDSVKLIDGKVIVKLWN